MAEIIITGRIVGAYRDEPGFEVEVDGEPSLKSLTELLQMLLGGDAEADGNGIYSGSGNVPNATIANVVGTLKFESTADAGEIQIRVDDEAGRNSFHKTTRLGTLIETNGIDDTSQTQIETDKSRIYLRSENDDSSFTLEVSGNTVRLIDLPVYANDAAATADASLQVKSLYLTTGSNVVKIKL